MLQGSWKQHPEPQGTGAEVGLQPWQQEAKTRPLKQAAGSSTRKVSVGIPKGLALLRNAIGDGI